MSPSPPPHLSVVLPAYREAENLRVLLPRLGEVLRDLPYPSEVLVIDLPTRVDPTEAVCAEAEVRHLRRAPGTSFGDAYRTGIEAAQGRFVAFMDADGSHAPEFLPELLAVHEDHDVVIASRYAPGGSTDNPWVLIFMSWVLNRIYGLVLGLPVADISNSFRVYRGDLLRQLDLECENFDVVEEILYKLRLRNPGLRIHEVPFRFERRLHGETKRDLVRFVLTFALTLVRLRRLR